MPSRIVTSTYRYKRPMGKRKAVPLEGPAIVTKRTPAPRQTSAPKPAAANNRKPVIVTAKRRRGRFGDAPDLTPEEYRRRGDAAFREMVRRTIGKP
jgi:hypothetical protein